jgi:hypothetical protein
MRTEQLPELFGVTGVTGVIEVGTGHINRTFLVTAAAGRYILQSLNRSVFTSPETVMANIAQTEQAFSGCPDVRVPHFLTCGGMNYASADGEIWRMYAYSEGSEQERSLYRAGFSYGAFIRVMSTSCARIEPVIPGFHDLGGYISRLREVCPEGGIPPLLISAAERLKSCFEGVPLRIIHGDAKTDNVIVGETCTVLDLDTVMTGYAALDYGDMVRSVCAGSICTESVREVTRGFTEGLGSLLTPRERETLYCGVLWTVCELAVRYLTDYYSPVRYFRGRSREQCLVRSRELLAQLGDFLAAEQQFRELL